ncbi:MAG: phosphoglycerate kinase [Chlamydiota bacterium]|jgi:phosphoglycerate kinase
MKLSIRDLSVTAKKVLMRVDFNVPMNKQGAIADDTRIRAALKTIHYALDQGASVILMSHLGRPKAGFDPALSLAPIAKRLSELLGRPVQMAPDCVGPKVEELVKRLGPGEVLLLENLRFHPGEEHPEREPQFALALAKLGDLYVDDAFGAAHREHTSVTNLARLFSHKAAMGFLMEEELRELGLLLEHPKRPYYAIMGGAKISTKIGVIRNLLKSVDALFLGGGMTYTFLKAAGGSVGDSIVEDDQLELARALMRESVKPLYMPKDLVIATKCEAGARTKTILIKEPIPSGWQGVDVGPQTIQEWGQILQGAATIFWNGPVGVVEIAEFAQGTQALARQLAALSAAHIVIGGGDSVAAIEKMGLSNQFDHLSTGGGAALEFLEFGTLPGAEALSDR